MARMLCRAACALVLLGLMAPLPTAAAPPLGRPTGLVPVGSAAAESSVRQVVRTPAGRVYLAGADDGGSARANPALRMFRAGQLGVPSSFTTISEDKSVPVPTGQALSGGDARLDRAGVIHVAWYRTDTGTAIHQTFSTRTDTWGVPETVALVPNGAGNAEIGRRGRVLTGMALDAAGVPFFALVAPSSVSQGPGFVRVYRRSGSGPAPWVLDAQVSQGFEPYHPSVSFDRQGRLHLAWLENSVPAIRYAVRGANGVWSAVEAVDSGDPAVQHNDTFDQSPSIAVDAADRPVVAYLDNTADLARVSARDAGGAWQPEHPPGVGTHAPGIFLNGDDRYLLLGHDIPGIHPGYLTRAGGAAGWSDTGVFAPPPGTGAYEYDGSGSARFDPLYDTNPCVIDAVFLDEDSDARRGFRPDLYYAAIVPPATPRCRPPALTGLRLTRTAFRGGDPRARLALRLSRTARLRLTVRRALPGRLRGRTCRGGLRTGRRCTRHVVVRRLPSAARAGATSIALGARLPRRGLAAGAYHVEVVAEAGGRRSAARRVAFRLLPAPR